MKIPKEIIKEFVKSEDFKSTGDITESIKSMFSDVMNEVLQCKIEEKLGYDKNERTASGDEERNYRNGSTKRKIILFPIKMVANKLPPAALPQGK